MNTYGFFKKHAWFWTGTVIVTLGYYLSLTASLLNLYHLQNSADPLFIMMLIEAMIPLLSLKILSVLFQKNKPKKCISLLLFLGFADP